MRTDDDRLTPAENERLAYLAEECAEVIQIIGKIQRHGFDNRNPLVPNAPTNRELLGREIADVQRATAMLVKQDRVVPKMVGNPSEWLHYQDDEFIRIGDTELVVGAGFADHEAGTIKDSIGTVHKFTGMQWAPMATGDVTIERGEYLNKVHTSDGCTHYYTHGGRYDGKSWPPGGSSS